MCWADENPLWLTAAVTSIAPLLDHLVALDGKYMLYPGAMQQPSSDVMQSMAVLEAASACNLGVTLHRPSEPFMGNEVQKRQLSIDLAMHFAESEDDWCVVFDADMVARHNGLASARADLEQSDHLVAEYARYEDPADEGCTPIRGIYRLVSGLTYGPAHYCISAPTSDGDRVWLWGNPNLQEPYVDALDLTQTLKFDHRNKKRDRARHDRAWDYYGKRDSLGIERLTETLVQDLDGNWVSIAH